MQNHEHISHSVKLAMEQYFRDLDGETPTAVYDMVLACVEKPLIEVVLVHTQGNQTRAAELLGLNRNTLRKKMKAYSLI
ncbi:MULTISPECIES: helix-turn-helix domain-containing protein [Craterilacuibacter]|jgi:Fis family transcriptional regulator|uniref:Putative Fis-like DNA-binding protein n=1 Tax=Craterilacuibacter sinensis TaxID=2686017 RepID=A0A845BIL3_9NEIS|nr:MULTISPECIES: helix-turn-helix domain-containing protein [Craterilacuibacter]MCL6263383.1 Fis family transcriptional regulator [Craterilacuibacter sp. RT1T]MCP9760424.1 Fis family transcriptional regulator [Aquitalea sp. S1-19]MXR36039.1 Fis family transcriptional regulator [Craterilacuibacter sinensis]RQW28325.1 Fis family transcriptional regulator [Rhodobacteraceae bacterium CH30]